MFDGRSSKLDGRSSMVDIRGRKISIDTNMDRKLEIDIEDGKDKPVEEE